MFQILVRRLAKKTLGGQVRVSQSLTKTLLCAYFSELIINDPWSLSMQIKIIKFLLVLCLLLVLASELSSVSNADPIPKPAIFPVTLTILSPSYGQEISGNDFLLNFSITDIPNNEIRMWIYPDMNSGSSVVGIRPNSPPVEFNGSVWVYLDGNETDIFSEYSLSLNVTKTQPTLLYSFNLTGVPEGEHTLSVKFSCASQYSINLNGMSAPTDINVHSTTPTPSYQATQPLTEQLPILLPIITVVILVVALLLLYRRHQKTTNLNQT
jgi:hypothetical protein